MSNRSKALAILLAVIVLGWISWNFFPDRLTDILNSERRDDLEPDASSRESSAQVQKVFPGDFKWNSQVSNSSAGSSSESGGYSIPLIGSPRNWVRIQEYVLFQSPIGDEVVASARKANGAITKDQSLSPFAARTLEMSAEEEAAVNAALESYFAACGEWVSENLVVDEEASGEEIVYRFSADPAEAEARLHALKNGLTETLGSERGIRLLNMIPLLHYYGGAGLFDVEVKMWHFVSDTPLPEDDSYYDPHGLQFSMNVLNPMPNHGPFTGKGGSYRRFVEPYFGKEVFAHLIAGKESETGAPEATEGAEPSGGP